MINLRTSSKAAGALMALCIASAAFAQAVAVETKLFVERYVVGKDGAMERELKPATVVTPGDRVVYIVSYRNGGKKPATDFVITNPLSRNVEFAGEETPGAEMSVDGGKSWGRLAQLTVRTTDGKTRAARREDVTHLRWQLAQPIAPGSSSQVTFKARVK